MTERIYRFAEFELDVARGELRTGAASVRLQEKPLLLLCALLDRAQHLVTRDELRSRMWDARAVVDYEQGINVAMRKLRDALGDSAEQPRFIETFARKGYRFLVPVQIVDPAADMREPKAAASASQASGTLRTTLVRQPRLLWTVLIVAIAVAAGAWLIVLETTSRESGAIRSLAVLPLRNLSPEAGQEFFADGITEELIAHLAQRLPLRVISRTSVMRYKDTEKSVAQIAGELGVEAIVEGSVTRSGDRLSLTVQLIDATQDRHLWAAKYERRIEDILTVEAELSEAVANQIRGTLSPDNAGSAKARPVDPRVYELCLLGRYHWNKRTVAGLTKAENYFRQAIEGDPTYAPAYAGLADAYALRPSYDSVPNKEYYQKAAAAARRALELDDTLAEAHATLGLIALNGPTRGSTESHLRRAIELNPSYAHAHHWLGFFLLFSDRGAEALEEIELARQLDPLSAVINADQGHFLRALRRYEQARQSIKRAFELAPELGQPHSTLALVELATGHPQEAVKEAHIALALDPHSPMTLAETGYVLAVTGHTDEAQALLATLQDFDRRGSSGAGFSAMIQLGLGQRDQAIDALERRVGEANAGFGYRTLLRQWQAFAEIQGDERFQKLLAATPAEATFGPAR